jgi:hypothetical protein
METDNRGGCGGGGETSNQPLHPAQTQALVVAAAAAHDGIK